MPDDQELLGAIRDVVDAGNCSGCGACLLLHPGLALTLNAGGYARPTLVAEGTPVPGAATRFAEACPGVRVEAPAVDPAVVRDPVFGPVAGIWRGWATDPEARTEGSSGGVLTALSTWLAEQSGGEVVMVRSDPAAPARTVRHRAGAADAILSGAGSRYAPTAMPEGQTMPSEEAVVVGRPCEISAQRTLLPGEERPVLLSFFCAGVPSQWATDRLVRDLGNDPDDLASLRYRGGGWPGEFTAVAPDGTTGAVSYDESWGKVLGPTLQWRCKVCVDGTGEAADVAAGDFWRLGDDGRPSFDEAEGESVVIARTQRGLDLVRRAAAAGVLELEEVTVGDLYPRQPHQFNRRTLLAPRLLAIRASGGTVPSYKGYGLWRLAAKRPYRASRELVGAWRRYRTFRSTRTEER